MANIKIISNPYQKKTCFQSWDDFTKEWKDINALNNPNSRLVSRLLMTSFFPFVVKEIVDIIIDDYYIADEMITITFEGTKDEYDEIAEFCAEEIYQDKINLVKSDKYLENARDILPDIIAVFNKIDSTVRECITDKEFLENDFQKFLDATNDVVPICIMGNYSSGKSTFINAMIGYELLPTSDEPTTAKIYKIARSQFIDRGKIHFLYSDKSVSIRLMGKTYEIKSELNGDDALLCELHNVLSKASGTSIPVRIRGCIDVINNWANKDVGLLVSDVISIETPFDEDGIWGLVSNKFVIFDTPGSNSVSNLNHKDVLQKAMENLSNGLAMFVSERDSLDSTDNNDLYESINNMAELDNRFTMIIVNKADTANLNKEFTDADRTKILNQAIPSKMYAGGIYFVSSIMGLGYKNEGRFLDDHNAEIFADQYDKYTNPGNRFYKRLYRYDILPEQIKHRNDQINEDNPHPLYANSGLYSVERAVMNFANKYSSYNKCEQAKQILNRIVETVLNTIQIAKDTREKYRLHIIEQLESDKARLIDDLNDLSATLKEKYINEYDSAMKSTYSLNDYMIDKIYLQETEDLARRVNAHESKIDSKTQEIDENKNLLQRNAMQNLKSLFKEFDLEKLSKLADDFKGDFELLQSSKQSLKDAKAIVEKDTSADVIERVKADFVMKGEKIQKILAQASSDYWFSKQSEFKKELQQRISQTSFLTDEKREKLVDIIERFESNSLEAKANLIFKEDDFLKRFLKIVAKLDLNKLSQRFNDALNNQIDEYYNTYKNSDEKVFTDWSDSLLGLIEENIIEYSDALKNQQIIINEETKRITDLEFRRNILNMYIDSIVTEMNWKQDNAKVEG